MNPVRSSLLAVGILSSIAISCASKAPVSDAQLTTDIQSKLYSDASTRQANVAVAVKDGAVTLSGNVPNADVELAAMKIANGTAGVHGVADQMSVNTASAVPASGSGSAPANNLADAPKTAPEVARRSEPRRSEVANRARAESPVPAAVPVATPDGMAAGNTTTNNAPAPAPVAEARPAVPESVTIPAGDRVSVRTVDLIDSGKASDGQTYRASLEAPLTADGRVIVPAGAPVTLQITSLRGASRIKGQSELSLQATSVQYHGRNFPISSSVYSDEGKARGKNTALKTGLGAAAGALIGGLAGGGKGAGIGAAAGGGAGFGFNALTHGQQVKIPAETVLSFRLENSLTVPAPRQ